MIPFQKHQLLLLLANKHKTLREKADTGLDGRQESHLGVRSGRAERKAPRCLGLSHLRGACSPGPPQTAEPSGGRGFALHEPLGPAAGSAGRAHTSRWQRWPARRLVAPTGQKPGRAARPWSARPGTRCRRPAWAAIAELRAPAVAPRQTPALGIGGGAGGSGGVTVTARTTTPAGRRGRGTRHLVMRSGGSEAPRC